MIVWSNCFAGHGPTVHLPGVLGAYGASTGATAACMAKRKRGGSILCAWTFRFGTVGTHHLCKRCFPDGKPNRTLRPDAGWFRYVWPRRSSGGRSEGT